MLSLQKGDRKKPAKSASIYDVARESRVSVFTVSAVVNHKSHVGLKLRKRVEAAIRKLNYRPNLIARSLAKQRTHTIGMIVPDIANPFFPMVVRGAEDAAQKHGYNLLLCNSDDSLAKEEKSVELLLSKRVDGILLTKAAEDFRPSLRKMIKEVNIPFVLVMRTYPKLTKDAVITDDYQGAHDAVCHLARSGRRRIGLIGGPRKVSNAQARWEGFRDALKAEGLSYEPELDIEGDYRIESGFRAGHALLSRRPDGVYVANYLMTVGFLKAVEEMGLKCPDEIAAGIANSRVLRLFAIRLREPRARRRGVGAASFAEMKSRVAQSGFRNRQACADYVSFKLKTFGRSVNIRVFTA